MSNVKSYKLIKEYPESPKLGAVYTEQKNSRFYINGINTLYCSYFENQSDFWEEVIEKDYEILSFIRIEGQILNKTGDNTFTKTGFSNLSENYLLRHPDWRIHSIKRLSDDEIFTIGDIVQDSLTDELTNFKHQEIVFFNPGNKIICNALSGTTMPLSTIRKVKQLLFTTEDGVDIFEGDIYYVVAKKDIYKSTINSEYEIKAFDLEENNKSFKQYNWNNFWSFSNRERAEEYVLMYKACLSVDDILNVWSELSGNTRESLLDQSKLMSNIIKFAKNK
jgi:hypothetical protein